MFHPETGIGRRGIVLKNDGKAVVQGGSLAGGASGIQIQPVDAHCAPLRFEQAGKHTSQSALAAAGLTDDAQAFPLAEAQGNAAQDLLPFPAEQAFLVFLFEGDVDVVCVEQCVHAGILPGTGACSASRKRCMTALCCLMRCRV